MRRIHTLFFSIVAIMLLGILSVPASYGQGHYDPTQGLKIGLDGKVINNKTRKPVGNATIQLVGTSQKTKSDSTGTFRLANVGKGHKKLKITAKGYKTDTEKINRGKDMNLYITIRLIPKKSGKK
ncbi:MAG TPA: carboxypeptidase-like regulatory domain-containing protein [Balneolales bacterium]|nr:carboxypeptidase-like regulatory domain-containing protein [Balneolales bacterium]